MFQHFDEVVDVKDKENGPDNCSLWNSADDNAERRLLPLYYNDLDMGSKEFLYPVVDALDAVLP